MIKLICTDMDGTLLSSNNSVSEENKEALRYALDKGVHVAICTGRLFTSANFYGRLVGIKTPIISANGAYIRDVEKNKTLFESTLSVEEGKEIYSVLKKYNLSRFFNTWDTAIGEVDFSKKHAYVISNEGCTEEEKTKFVVEENLEDILDNYEGKILKCICIDYSEKYIEEVKKAREEVEKLNKYEVVCSSPYNFEIMKKGTSKGLAVKRLAEILGIKKEEILCIGDSENDLSMLEYAGVGVAMGNALDFVKEKADFVTLDNDNSGVAKAVYKMIKGAE